MLQLKAFGILTGIMVLMGIIIGIITVGVGMYQMETKEIGPLNYDIENGTHLEVNGKNGYIRVENWEEGHPNYDSIEVLAKLHTLWGKEALDKVDVKVTTGQQFEIKVTTEERSDWVVEVDLFIHIPPYVKVDKLKTDNGDIQLERSLGNTYIENTNGPVYVRDHTGDLEIQNTNGKLDVKNIVGDVDGETNNGGLYFSNIQGNLTCSTYNGRVDISEVNGIVWVETTNSEITIIDTYAIKKAETQNGDIDADFAVNTEFGSYFKTSNGNVRVKAPEDMNATFMLRSENGEIELREFKAVYSMNKHNEVRGDINGGGPDVKLITENGKVTLEGGGGM